MEDAPARLYRFRPRPTRKQRVSAALSAVAGGLGAAIAILLAVTDTIRIALALVLAGVCALAGGIAWHAFRQGFEAWREPREYRDALALIADGKRAEALDAVARATARKASAFAPWTLRGLILSESGDFDGALAAYREAIVRRPDAWIGHSGAGAALLNLGKLPEAVEALGKALALGANWPVPRYQLGLALFLRGEYAGAAEAFGEALALGLDAPNVQLVARSLRAWALEHTGSPDAAREEQERARPLRGLDEVGAFRDRLRGAKLSPVGKLAAWAVGVDTSDEPPRL